MNAALAAPFARDPFMPRPPHGMGPGLVLALVAHALLVAALAFGVNWRTSEPQAVVAELWSAVPQFAAPRAVEAPPPPPPPPPPTPTPQQRAPEPVVKPAPEPAPPRDAQIAVEKAAQRKEQLERLAAEREIERLKERERAREKESAKAREKTRLKAEQADTAERAKREATEAADEAKALAAKQAQQQAAARESYQKRMRELAGSTGGPTDTGNAVRSSGPSAGYAGRIMARIKPNIVFNDVVDGNPMATVEVKLALDGTIVAKRLVKSSGVKSWDDAVLRAIERTEILPRDTDGRVPPPFQIDFKLRE